MLGNRLDGDILVRHRDSLAQAFGLESLRVGKHIIRDDRRFRTGEKSVRRCWVAIAAPSFDAQVAVALVAFGRHLFRGEETPECFSATAGVVDANSIHLPKAIDVHEDTLESILTCVDLSPSQDHLFLDGVGYLVHHDTASVSSTLAFGNPTDSHLMAIERALLSTAEQVAVATSDKLLYAAVRKWSGYVQDRQRR